MHSQGRGFTMVELMIVIALLGISLVLAIPTYQEVQQRRAVTTAAEQVTSFLRIARSEAIKRNLLITATVNTAATPFCAGIDDGTAACNCRAANACRITQGATNTDLTLSGNDFESILTPVMAVGNAASTALTFTFDPIRGVLTTDNNVQGTILMSSSNSKYQLQISTGRAGRIEICTVTGGQRVAVPGYQTCA